MSLYKNYFKFIFDNSNTDIPFLGEGSPQFRAFFEDETPGQGEQLTPAQRAKLMKLPGRSNLYVKDKPRNKMNPNLWAGVPRDNPTSFVAVRINGRDTETQAPEPSVGVAGSGEGGGQQPAPDMSQHERRKAALKDIKAVFKSSTIFSGVPVGLDEGDIKYINKDDTEAFQVGDMTIQKSAGLDQFEVEEGKPSPSVDDLRKSFFYQRELKKARQNFSVSDDEITSDEMGLRKADAELKSQREADRAIQSALAANRLVKMLMGPGFRDKNGKFIGTIKTMNSMGSSIDGMVDGINEAFHSLRKKVRDAQGKPPAGTDEKTDGVFGLVRQGLEQYGRERPLPDSDRAAELRNQIWGNARVALLMLKNTEYSTRENKWADDLSMDAVTTMAESFSDFFTVASGTEQGYHFIPKSTTLGGVDSITVFRNSDAARGIRLDTFTIDAGQVKFDTGTSTSNILKNELSICGPIPVPKLGDEDARVISGLDAHVDSRKAFEMANKAWRIHSLPNVPQLPRDVFGTSKKVDMNNAEDVAARDAFLENNVGSVAEIMESSTDRNLAQIDKLYDKYNAAILYHIGFDETQVEELFQNTTRAKAVLDTVKGLISMGHMPILNKSEIQNIATKTQDGKERTIRDYSTAIQTNNGTVEQTVMGTPFREQTLNVEFYNKDNNPQFDALGRKMWKLSMLSSYLGCALIGDSVIDYQAFSLIKFGTNTVEVADGGMNPKLDDKKIRVSRSTPRFMGDRAVSLSSDDKYGSNTQLAFLAKMFNFYPGDNMGSTLQVTNKKPKSFDMFGKLRENIERFFKRYNARLWG